MGIQPIESEKKYLIEEPITEKANQLMQSGEWRFERFSETRGWLLVRRRGK